MTSDTIAVRPSSLESRPTVQYLALSIIIMMFVTIAAPADFTVRQHGTKSILPPKVISLAKIVARAAVLVVIGGQVVLTTSRARRDFAIRPLIPFFAFGMFGMASVAWSARSGDSLKQSISFLVLMLIAAAVAIHVDSLKRVEELLHRASVCLIMIGIGLLVVAFAAPQYGALTKESAGLFHSTSAGASSSLSILILVASRLLWNWTWTHRWLLPGLLIHGAVLLVAGNRLSLILAIGFCGIAIGALLPIRQTLGIGLAFSGIVMTAILCDPSHFVVQDIVHEVTEFGRQGQSTASLKSLSGRSEMWQAIWDSFLESIWIGHGYFVTSAEGELFVWYEWGNWTAHNFLLQLLATTGIVGTLIFHFGIACLAYRILGSRCEPKLRLLLILIGLWYFAWGQLNASFLGPLQTESVLFAIAAGLACSPLLNPARSMRGAT